MSPNPTVVAQRGHGRRVEAQIAGEALVERNRQARVTGGANVDQPAIGIPAASRRREEDGLCFCGIGVKIPPLQGAVPGSIDLRKRTYIVSSRCESCESIAGRKFKADGTGIVDGFDNRIVVSGTYGIIGTP